jgi:hypothetical protein
MVLTLLSVASAEAQSVAAAAALEGAWIRTATVGPTGHVEASPPGMRTFIGGHFTWLQANADRPIPDSTATAAQLREIWGTVTAIGGTYEVVGNIVTQRALVDRNPGGMQPGVYASFAYSLRGDSLWLTQIENSARGLATNLPTGLYVRVRGTAPTN